MSRRAALAAATGAAVLAAGGYWRHMSPYSQALGEFPYRSREGSERGRTVALTFDDGPNEPYTSQVASILETRNIAATFFQVGRCVERNPQVTRDLATAGHVIGNHSYSHRFASGWNRQDLTRQIELAQGVFAEHLGRLPSLYRPPWLIRTSAMFDVLAEHQLRPVSGEFCHAFEPLQPSPQRIARRTLAKAREGGILIFHDGYDDVGGPRDNTVAAVEIVVDTLLDRGFCFVTVDRLLGFPAYASLD
jgi:peptidoglycan/xylan/chitin deacetylase (PgdA/CDA1 family)